MVPPAEPTLVTKSENSPKEVHISYCLPQSLVDGDEDVMADGVRSLFPSGDFADVLLRCAGQTFRAHRVVLAARSIVFRAALSSSALGPSTRLPCIEMNGVEYPQAVQLMLEHMYGVDKPYSPQTQEVNKDVLRLAQTFKLASLRTVAKRHLTKDLDTTNVVDRLAVCSEYELEDVYNKILNVLTLNREALALVASSSQIMTQPKLMQTLLQLAAQPIPVQEPSEDKPPKKPRRI